MNNQLLLPQYAQSLQELGNKAIEMSADFFSKNIVFQTFHPPCTMFSKMKLNPELLQSEVFDSGVDDHLNALRQYEDILMLKFGRTPLR